MNEPEQKAMEAFLQQQSLMLRENFKRRGMDFTDEEWTQLIEIPLELTYHEGNAVGHEVQILCHSQIINN